MKILHKCLWCDSRTDNTGHLALDANQQAITVIYCDNCQKADKEFRHMFKKLNDKPEVKRLMQNLADL